MCNESQKQKRQIFLTQAVKEATIEPDQKETLTSMDSLF